VQRLAKVVLDLLAEGVGQPGEPALHRQPHGQVLPLHRRVPVSLWPRWTAWRRRRLISRIVTVAADTMLGRAEGQGPMSALEREDLRHAFYASIHAGRRHAEALLDRPERTINLFLSQRSGGD
jgi:hypothetical protein